MNEYKLIYYLKKDKTDHKGDSAIYARISAGGENISFSIKRYISKKRWNETNHLRNPIRNEDELEIQNYLKRIEREVSKIVESLFQSKISIKASYIKNFLQTRDIELVKRKANNTMSLMEVIRNHNDRFNKLVQKNARAPSTLTRYETGGNIFEDFLKIKLNREDIFIDEMDYNLIDEFDLYLRTEKKYRKNVGCENNTTVKYIRNLKTICNYALKKGWITNNPFDSYEGKMEETNPVFLTEGELEIIEEKIFSTDRLNIIKDLFLFSCYTSLAPCDIKTLSTANIVVLNNEKWIKLRRAKSKTNASIILLPRAERLINKYKDHPICLSTGQLLPVRSNQKVNEYLKEIANICGINKNLTWYVGRHTFATIITLLNGVSMESVSKMMGHKRLSQTQHYARIINQKVSQDMQKVKKKFN